MRIWPARADRRGAATIDDDREPHPLHRRRGAGRETPQSSINPSNTDEVVARFPAGGEDEVDRAVQAARAAFPAWADASPEVRSDLLDKVGATIMARAKELGELLAREEGKTLAEAPAR